MPSPAFALKGRNADSGVTNIRNVASRTGGRWLAQTQHWNMQSIGMVLSAGLLAGMLLSTPAGALVDRVGHPRAMLAATCISVVLGTSALLLVHGFWPVLIAQVMVAGAEH